MKNYLKTTLLVLMAAVLLVTGCDDKEETVKTKYKITFDTDGGSEIFAQEVEAGNLAQKPTDPTKQGYTFDGWEYNGTEYNFNETVSTNMTLKAKWKSAGVSYTVKFDSDGGSTVYSKTVSEGNTITKPTDPTKEGYTFKYWTLNDAEYNFDTPVTANVELKAVWVSNSDGPHTVTFDSDGGTEVAEQTVKHNKKATAPKAPTKTGYVFLDWTLDGKIYSFSTKVTADITLVATWAKEGNYTITFDTNGSTDVIASQIVKAGKLVTKPNPAPTKEGYELKEWQFEGQAYDFTKKVSQDMTLKAIWQLPHFDVVFNSDGGSTVKTQSVEINKKASTPKAPTKTGYTFLGWFIGEDEYDFNTPVTAAITLVAKWQPVKYVITFDSNGGSAVPDQLVEYGGKVTKPADPTREGYDFKGWKLGTAIYKFDTATVTKAITLKADWTKATAKTYTFKVVPVDQYSPDREIVVYENGTKINYTSIKIGNAHINSHYVHYSDIEGVNSITVIFENGSSVTATLSS